MVLILSFFNFLLFFVSLNKITESANLSHDLIKVQCANMPMVETQSRILIFVYGNRDRIQPSSLKLNASANDNFLSAHSPIINNIKINCYKFHFAFIFSHFYPQHLFSSPSSIRFFLFHLRKENHLRQENL